MVFRLHVPSRLAVLSLLYILWTSTMRESCSFDPMETTANKKGKKKGGLNWAGFEETSNSLIFDKYSGIIGL
jgi:hypothetical protein